MTANEPGTLMWIGPTSGAFNEAYQYCLRNSAQLAVREHCEQALQRRAVSVRGIVLARGNRTPISAPALSHLRRRYSAAEFTQLLGPLALGIRSCENLPANERMAWYHWKEVLQTWLENWGAAEPQSPKEFRSVLVVASHLSAAEPLLDLAASTGAATAWIKSPDGLPFQNFDVVWWDDSAANPANTDDWRHRITTCNQTAHHVWIVTNPSLQEIRTAHQAGVQRIMAKPHQIDSLLDDLADQSPSIFLKAA